MRILKLAIFGIILGSLQSPSHAVDLEKLTTTTGRVYYDIEIINSDKHGLLFRHSKGIAKESFPNLSNSIRDMFQPVGDVPTDKGAMTNKKLPTDKGNISGKGSDTQHPVTVLTIRQRFTVPVATGLQNPHCLNYGNLHPNPHNWPIHWHRFHPAHYLTNPICREQATRNFLHHTGLLPRTYRQSHFAAPSRNTVRAIHAPIQVTRPAIRFY